MIIIMIIMMIAIVGASAAPAGRRGQAAGGPLRRPGAHHHPHPPGRGGPRAPSAPHLPAPGRGGQRLPAALRVHGGAARRAVCPLLGGAQPARRLLLPGGGPAVGLLPPPPPLHRPRKRRGRLRPHGSAGGLGPRGRPEVGRARLLWRAAAAGGPVSNHGAGDGEPRAARARAGPRGPLRGERQARGVLARADGAEAAGQRRPAREPRRGAAGDARHHLAEVGDQPEGRARRLQA